MDSAPSKPAPPKVATTPVAQPKSSIRSEILKRLIEEIRLDEVRQTGVYNRTYHRHNR